MGNELLKRCRMALAAKEIRIKTTVRDYFIPSGMAVTEKDRQQVLGFVETSDPSYITGGDTEWCGHFEKPLDSFLKS